MGSLHGNEANGSYHYSYALVTIKQGWEIDTVPMWLMREWFTPYSLWNFLRPQPAPWRRMYSKVPAGSPAPLNNLDDIIFCLMISIPMTGWGGHVPCYSGHTQRGFWTITSKGLNPRREEVMEGRYELIIRHHTMSLPVLLCSSPSLSRSEVTSVPLPALSLHVWTLILSGRAEQKCEREDFVCKTTSNTSDVQVIIITSFLFKSTTAASFPSSSPSRSHDRHRKRGAKKKEKNREKWNSSFHRRLHMVAHAFMANNIRNTSAWGHEEKGMRGMRPMLISKPEWIPFCTCNKISLPFHQHWGL